MMDAWGMGFPFFFMSFFFLAGLAGTAFMIWMLIDCVRHKFKNDTDRVIWVLIIVFLHWLGALVYFLAVKRKV